MAVSFVPVYLSATQAPVWQFDDRHALQLPPSTDSVQPFESFQFPNCTAYSNHLWTLDRCPDSEPHRVYSAEIPLCRLRKGGVPVTTNLTSLETGYAASLFHSRNPVTGTTALPPPEPVTAFLQVATSALRQIRLPSPHGRRAASRAIRAGHLRPRSGGGYPERRASLRARSEGHPEQSRGVSSSTPVTGSHPPPATIQSPARRRARSRIG